MEPLANRFDRFRSQGDLQALGAVFDETAPRLLKLATHLSANPADAEDVLQQTFVLAIERAETFDARRPLEPWLAGLLGNVARNAQRAAGRRQTAALPELAVDDEGPRQIAERNELVAGLRANVDSLPAEQRRVLLLQLQHGLSAAEIAEVLDEAPGTVRMRLHRGLRSLRRLLGASFASLFAGAASLRGMNAVRSNVMRQASKRTFASSVSASTAAISGVLMMKAVAVILCVGLLASFLWWNAGVPGTPTASGTTDAPTVLATSDNTSTREPSDTPTVRAKTTVATGTLRVRVVAKSLNLPLGGAFVRVWRGESAFPPYDGSAVDRVADARGEVVLDDCEPGPWHALLVADREAKSGTAQVAAGETATLEVRRPGRRIVRGTVVDAADQPVVGAAIWTYRRGGMGRYLDHTPLLANTRRAGISDELGRFEVATTTPEQTIGARKAGYGPSFGMFLWDDREPRIRLRLSHEFATVSGIVRDRTGRPIPGTLVQARLRQDQRRAADGTLLTGWPPPVAKADDAGRFVFETLPPGIHTLWARGTPFIGWTDVEAVAFQQTEVVLEMHDGIGVFGRVLDANGDPASGLKVEARPNIETNGHFSQSLTRPDGTYALPEILARKFFVVVESDREVVNPKSGIHNPRIIASRKIEEAAGTVHRVDFQLSDWLPAPRKQRPVPPRVAEAKPAKLTAIISRADGSTWRGALPGIRLTNPAGKPVRCEQQRGPRGVTVRAEPGRYRVAVAGADLIAAPQKVELVADQERTVHFAVAIGRSRDLVFNGDGADELRTEKLRVVVRDQSGAIVVDDSSALCMPHLEGFKYWTFSHTFPFGRYSVDAHSDDGLHYRTTFDVRENLTDPTRIDVPAVGR